MSDDSFDPAVVALLQEIAADPRASLLRIPKERLIRWVGRPEEVVKPSGSYLTKAEKHLVAAYREEAAWVLLQGCIVQLKSLPLVFSKHAPDLERLTASAKGVLRTGVFEASALRPLEDLASGSPSDAIRLGSAALTLAPNDQARNCLAVAYHRSGSSRTSLRMLEVIRSGNPPVPHLSQALENTAMVLTAHRAFSKALRFAVQATTTDEAKVRLLVWCLTASFQLGEKKRVMEYAAKIERHPGRLEVPALASALMDARSREYWAPTVASKELVRSVRGSVGDLAWKVCDVFS